MNGRRPRASELLAHEGFVRAIIGSILPDQNHRDDVLQDTWLVALQRPPKQPSALKSWLATVARNIARKVRRGERRRTRREQAAARVEHAPPTDEVAARNATYEHVVESVLSLGEPYRSTVLLRFYEGLTIAEVARNLGVSNTAVRKRLRRAFVILRTRLRQPDVGTNPCWWLALVPASRPALAGADASARAGASEGVGAFLLSCWPWVASAVINAIVVHVLLSTPPQSLPRPAVLHAVLSEVEELDDVPGYREAEPELQSPHLGAPIPEHEIELEGADVDDASADDAFADALMFEDAFPAARVNGSAGNSVVGLGGRVGGALRRERRGGVSVAAENAVEVGLRWLADHQDLETDGRWDCDGFMTHDPIGDKCDGAGGPRYDVGVTGLALLAFLGAGYSDRGGGQEQPFAQNVRGGLRFLLRSQDEQGVFGTRATNRFMYNHAIATQAMCEAYWMTRNPRYKRPAQAGLNFLAMARNPYAAWRYAPRAGESDTSVSVWCVLALRMGVLAGLEVDPDALAGARRWVEGMTDPNFGVVGYTVRGGASARPRGARNRFPAARSQAMTAAGILTRVLLGEDPGTSDAVRKGVDLCANNPPVWNSDMGAIDMYYWYCGTLALFQAGGARWHRWQKATETAIVAHRCPRGSGSRAGSWDPIGCWGEYGGRVYSTALMVLCLEAPYRYREVLGGGAR